MRRHLGVIVLILAVMAVAALAWRRHVRMPGEEVGTAPSPSHPPATLVVEQAQYRSSGAFDPGTLRILLRNPNDFPIRLTQLTWDGLPLPAFGVDLDWRNMPPRRAGEDEFVETAGATPGVHGFSGSAAAKTPVKDIRRVKVPDQLFRAAYWTRIEPSGELPPNGVAMIAVKPSSAPARRVRFDIAGLTRRDQMEPQPLASFFVEPVSDPLSIARVAFAEDGKRMFVYVANDGYAPRTLARMEINSRLCEDGLWMPQTDIPGGSHAIIGVTPPTPFMRGEFVTVRVTADRGGAIAQVRAFWGFPMGVESGSPPPGRGLDAAARVWRPGFLNSAYADLPAPNHAVRHPGGIRAMTCVICGLGQLNTVYDTAQEMLRRYEAACLAAPGVPVMVNPCRVDPEKGYALFAPTADALMANPAVPTSLASSERSTPAPGPRTEEAIAAVAHLARAGRMASAPALYYPLLSTNRHTSSAATHGEITPEEFRARLYTLLAEGADGLFYRHDWSGGATSRSDLDRTIRAANPEVAQLRPWLSLGGLRGEAGVEGPEAVTASTRSAGDRGVLVFLIRKDAGAVSTDSASAGHDEDDGHGHEHPTAAPAKPTALPVPGVPVRVTVPLPSWAKPAGVFLARSEGLFSVEMTRNQGSISFVADIPEGGAGYVVKFEDSPKADGEAKP